MDAIPVLSQAKSLLQFIFGQWKQAEQTQINFLRQCPVVSQTTSFVQWLGGDSAGARETQGEFVKFVGNVINGIPFAGHAKGLLHYAVGDRDAGDLAMKSAFHTTTVIVGGVGGMMVGGPVGAYIGGAASGVVMDGTITAIDSAKKEKPTGFGAFEPIDNPCDAGKWIDSITGIATDSLLGGKAGGATSITATAGAVTRVLNVKGQKFAEMESYSKVEAESDSD